MGVLFFVVACFAIIGIIGVVVIVAYAINDMNSSMNQNRQEHEELRALDCDDNIIEWINKHPRWIDHRDYALQLFNACQINGDKPLFRGHD